jgi:hypothetical protein
LLRRGQAARDLGHVRESRLRLRQVPLVVRRIGEGRRSGERRDAANAAKAPASLRIGDAFIVPPFERPPPAVGL